MFVVLVRQLFDGFELRPSEGLNGWTVADWVRAGTTSVLELRGGDTSDGVRDRVDKVHPLPIDGNLRVREVHTAEEEADGDEGRRASLRGLDGRAYTRNELT